MSETLSRPQSRKTRPRRQIKELINIYGTANTGDAVKLDEFRRRLEDCDDVIYTDIVIGKNVRATVLTVDGMVDAQLLNESILKPLVLDARFGGAETADDVRGLIADGYVYHSQRVATGSFKDAMASLLFGGAVLVFEDGGEAVLFDVKGFEHRGISEPTTENVLKGSKDAFVESLRTNTAIMRKRVQTDDLKIVQTTVGRRTNTPVALVYIKGVANSELVKSVTEKIEAADLDGLVSAGQLESVLQKYYRSIFPQLLYTERADKFVGNILEGRVGIFVDGLPFGYVMPVDLNAFLQSADDYSLHFVTASLLRILRYFCTFAALVLPGFYVAVMSFHQEMIPTKLVVAIIASKRGVPFPSYLEAILMLVALEILLEAGARLPQAVGQTVGIVGALVIGQAAITAHILSPGVVIVVSSAGIAGFVVPNQDLSIAVRTCRMLLVLLTSLAGLFGLSVGLVVILYHLCSIEVFGTPYLSPAGGAEWKRLLSDTIVRQEWYKQNVRPPHIHPEDDIRLRDTRKDENEI
jgi:spore germination protein KA